MKRPDGCCSPRARVRGVGGRELGGVEQRGLARLRAGDRVDGRPLPAALAASRDDPGPAPVRGMRAEPRPRGGHGGDPQGRLRRDGAQLRVRRPRRGAALRSREGRADVCIHGRRHPVLSPGAVAAARRGFPDRAGRARSVPGAGGARPRQIARQAARPRIPRGAGRRRPGPGRRQLRQTVLGRRRRAAALEPVRVPGAGKRAVRAGPPQLAGESGACEIHRGQRVRRCHGPPRVDGCRAVQPDVSRRAAQAVGGRATRGGFQIEKAGRIMEVLPAGSGLTPTVHARYPANLSYCCAALLPDVADPVVPGVRRHQRDARAIPGRRTRHGGQRPVCVRTGTARGAGVRSGQRDLCRRQRRAGRRVPAAGRGAARVAGPVRGSRRARRSRRAVPLPGRLLLRAQRRGLAVPGRGMRRYRASRACLAARRGSARLRSLFRAGHVRAGRARPCGPGRVAPGGGAAARLAAPADRLERLLPDGRRIGAAGIGHRWHVDRTSATRDPRGIRRQPRFPDGRIVAQGLLRDRHARNRARQPEPPAAGTAPGARDALRAVDCIARLGGDEFAVLLPETNLRGATEVANKLQTAVRHAGGKSADGMVLTLSIGATAIATGEDLKNAMKRADDALYAAKRAGRDRVMTSACKPTMAVVQRTA
ncbi:hypothetical protein Lal_00015059 [Lupinus albus]|nr:hypothetical protein Lal_00015059 [Lupinus albus]